jgi:DNA-binding winged helix-turn-helix (wHTH) protein/tetratricopeptide (TPR) repeat protein
LPRRAASAARPIDLAHTRPFRIGDTDVRPATRELIQGDRREVLEPLVMQVLIALASARGAILSRDDLIDACWGGRAVSDDALNRVLSRLRALARTFETFEVETITKVGYRLVAEGEVAAPSPTRVQRRHVILGAGAAAGLGLAGLAAWRFADRPKESPEAQVLIQKGFDALQSSDVFDTRDQPGAFLQAIALLTDATRAAPQSAEAWGGLAMAYAARKRNVPLSERPGLDARSRTAASKALALDPRAGRALGALRLLDPVYRNWIAVERADREALAKKPGLPILLFAMADLLGSVGRWKEAAHYSKQLDRTKFLIPGADRRLIVDLWASGDLQAADQALENAVKQWPQYAPLWRTRFAYLMYSGRPRDVLAIVRDATDRPVELSPEYLEAIRVTAEALAGLRRPSEAVSHQLDYLKANPSEALQVAQACAALEARAAAFELLDGYYFGEGAWSQLAPKGGDQDRVTSPLFHPVMSSLWREPEFDRLLHRIGLEEYWRRTGTQPDYRKA